MRLRALLQVPVALLLLSCASGNVPAPESMPAARAGLRPEYRLFYDAMQDNGDWTLIEPYGYVFRPRANVIGWQPYEYGFWVASDIYGWVWVSTEPYGWATYHYGQWLYDRFQGWVWIPGIDWGPAWVAWVETDDYVGWSPLLASGSARDQVPDGGYLFVATGDLPSPNLASRLRRPSELGDRIARARPVDNLADWQGIVFNRGPSFERIQRAAGFVPRAHIEDAVPGVDPRALARQRSGTRGTPADLAEATRRAAEQAALDAQAMIERGTQTPDRVIVVRPLRPASPAPEPRSRRRSARPAVADTAR